MKIRAITAFIPLVWPFDEGSIAGVGHFLADAQARLQNAGIEVQTIRLATPPFLDVIGDPDPATLIEFAQALETMAEKHNIEAVSVGPVVATTPLALLMSIQALPRLISETKITHSGVLFADDNSGINLSAAHAFAQVVHDVAHSTPKGAGNLRLGALANISDTVPYFPAAYHHGGLPCFAIATEAADLAIEAIDQTRSLNDAAQGLVRAIEKAGSMMLEVADHLVDDHQIRFRGIDFSLAPSPGQSHSIGAAIEHLGIDVFGGNGTLFAANFLADCIQEANIPHIGLSSVKLPLLEDSLLAQRAKEGHFDVNDLLTYSAVCGAGLDGVPIPGDTGVEEIAAIFVDLAALSIATGKPLVAQLLPMPGLTAGQAVPFAAETFAAGCVLPVRQSGAEGLFRRGTHYKARPKPAAQRNKSGSYPQFYGSRRRR